MLFIIFGTSLNVSFLSTTDKSTTPHPLISNDDLLYDPNMDDDDQRWVDAQRSRCQPNMASIATDDKMATGNSRKRKAGAGMTKPLPNSDAVLNCPACMSLLCRDCQRYSNGIV